MRTKEEWDAFFVGPQQATYRTLVKFYGGDATLMLDDLLDEKWPQEYADEAYSMFQPNFLLMHWAERLIRQLENLLKNSELLVRNRE